MRTLGVCILVSVMACIVYVDHLLASNNGKFPLTFEMVHHYRKPEIRPYDKYRYQRTFDKCIYNTKEQFNTADACEKVAMNTAIK